MAKPQAFAAMAFQEPFNQIYREIIKPTLSKCGFDVLRADEMKGSTDWMQDTQDKIASSDLVVADVTGRNPNVYHEVGIGFALKKEQILLIQESETIPADTTHIRHLKYNSEHLTALQDTLEEWVKASKAYTLRARRITPHVLSRGDIFDDIADTTFYMHHTMRDDKNDILQYIRGGRLIPPSYLYRFERGAALWIELCKDPGYHYYTRSVEFFRTHVGKILDAIDGDILKVSPDLISLGPGNGVKDRLILNNMIDRLGDPRTEMYYYPFDISASMISTAIGHISTYERIKDRIKIKAIVADFSTLKRFEPVYQYRPEPNIFTLLGNTLGNMEGETNFLQQIKRAMFPNDILIVEVRCKSTNGASGIVEGSEDVNKRFDFTPLDSLGVDFEAQKLDYEARLNRSSIPGTRTIIASYFDFQIPGDEYRMESALLSYVHEYDADQVKRVMDGLHPVRLTPA